MINKQPTGLKWVYFLITKEPFCQRINFVALIVQSTEFTLAFKYLKEFFFSNSTIHVQLKKLSCPLNSWNDTSIVFLSCMCELITMAGSNFLDGRKKYPISSVHDICTFHYIKYDLPTILTATRCPRSPDSENEFGYPIYEIFTCFRGVLCADNQ